MILIPDAPWIRDAELNGYPVGDDIDDNDIEIFDFCPRLPSWLATGAPKGEII